MHKSLAEQANLRRPRQPGDLHQLQCTLWWAYRRVEEFLVLDEIPEALQRQLELRLRTLRALSQAAASYGNLLRPAELEARLAALERKAYEGPGPTGAARGPVGARLGRR